MKRVQIHLLGQSVAVVGAILLELLCKTAYPQQRQHLDEATIRQAVEAVAAVISREYFDAEVATRTETTLRQGLSQGRYGGAVSLQSLAEILTRDLMELTHDKHLVVAVARDSGEQPRSEIPPDDSRMIRGRQVNFGIQRVEILSGNVGYLNLTALFRPEEARKTIAAALHTLKHADALILDLRNNSGGSPDTARLLLSYFFDESSLPLFEIVPRDGEARSYATDSSPLADRNGMRRMYVLTAKGTFSAGEGVAFILQERHRAEIVGEKTAGAANPGRSYPATSQLEVTVPNGKVRSAVGSRNWEGDGVIPDVAVAASDALRIAHVRALRELLKTTSGSRQSSLERDLNALEKADR